MGLHLHSACRLPKGAFCFVPASAQTQSATVLLTARFLLISEMNKKEACLHKKKVGPYLVICALCEVTKGTGLSLVKSDSRISSVRWSFGVRRERLLQDTVSRGLNMPFQQALKRGEVFLGGIFVGRGERGD